MHGFAYVCGNHDMTKLSCQSVDVFVLGTNSLSPQVA